MPTVPTFAVRETDVLLDLAKFQEGNGDQTRSNSKIQEKFSSIEIFTNSGTMNSVELAT